MQSTSVSKMTKANTPRQYGPEQPRSTDDTAFERAAEAYPCFWPTLSYWSTMKDLYVRDDFKVFNCA